MITSVDTNVLFDLFRTDSPHHFQSRGLGSIELTDRGAIIICDIVYAELVPEFARQGLTRRRAAGDRGHTFLDRFLGCL